MTREQKRKRLKRAEDRFYKYAPRESKARRSGSKLQNAWRELGIKLYEDMERMRRSMFS